MLLALSHGSCIRPVVSVACFFLEHFYFPTIHRVRRILLIVWMSQSKDHRSPLGDHTVKVSRAAIFFSAVTHLVSHSLLQSQFPEEAASGRKLPCENLSVHHHHVVQSVPTLLIFEPRLLGCKKYSAYGNACSWDWRLQLRGRELVSAAMRISVAPFFTVN